MKIIERSYRRTDEWWYPARASSPMLCHRYLERGVLHRLDIPRNVQRIWLSLHDKPADHRREVEIVVGDYGNNLIVCLSGLGIGYSRPCWGKVREILRPYVGKPLYLQVEYEEP
jgi:hypothetical protein